MNNSPSAWTFLRSPSPPSFVASILVCLADTFARGAVTNGGMAPVMHDQILAEIVERFNARVIEGATPTETTPPLWTEQRLAAAPAPLTWTEESPILWKLRLPPALAAFAKDVVAMVSKVNGEWFYEAWPWQGQWGKCADLEEAKRRAEAFLAPSGK